MTASTDITPEVAGKLRQFKRLVMSYADFKHARLVADYILENRLHTKYPKDSYANLAGIELLNGHRVLPAILGKRRAYAEQDS